MPAPPMPSSAISAGTPLSVIATVTRARVACACLATLVSASAVVK
jgi:hypothetical protein